jgi:hypothetical protein
MPVASNSLHNYLIIFQSNSTFSEPDNSRVIICEEEREVRRILKELFLSMVQQPLVGQGLLIIEAS